MDIKCVKVSSLTLDMVRGKKNKRKIITQKKNIKIKYSRTNKNRNLSTVLENCSSKTKKLLFRGIKNVK